MAAALTEAQIELASSLIEDEIPAKLRCAICSKLAINAFRLPCCETAICQNCQSTLPPACPVCEHSPVSAEDCTVYKSLRTTIRVFLKTEEKKRETARPKANASTPSTPADSTQTPTLTKAPTEPTTDVVTASQDEGVSGVVTDEQPLVASELQVDIVDASGQDANPQPAEGHSANNEPMEDAEGAGPNEEANGQDVQEADHLDDGNDEENADNKEASADVPGAGSLSESMNGSFNGMPFGNGDMNQMQMMMAMQNGMNPAAFGSFPMMGMGMGMDPMTMQNMFMNGGFGAQGMNGMNGMNMNMGMNGFNGGNNDWNGQQSWNIGQDNFNPNATGMGNGDFGNYNSGFRTGYNSGNYGHHNQFNDYGRGGYGYRGRGRGRGFYRGYGRGFYQGYNSRYGQNMWAQEAAQNSADYESQAQSNEPESLDRKGEGEEAATTDEFGRRLRPDTEQEQAEVKHGADGADQDSHGENGGGQQVSAHRGEEAHDDAAVPNGDVSSADAYTNTRGTSQGPGSLVPVTAPDVPLNAPTGPKAMRQGLPNTSALHLRARGLIHDERSSTKFTNAPVMASPTEERRGSRSSSRHSTRDTGHHSGQFRDYDDDREETRDKDYDEDQEGSGSYSKGRSHSQSRDRKESRRHRRHHSESVSPDDREDDYRHHRYKSRRSTRDEDDYKSRSKDERYDDKSRSISPDRDREHRHSSHRSRRDRDKDKDKDRDENYDRRRKSSHRPHHDYDRERDREKEREKDRPKDRIRDRDRDRSRDRDRDRDYRRSSRRTSVDEDGSADVAEKEFNPPTGPRGSLSIKGASSKANILEIRAASSKSSRRGSESSRRASQTSLAPVKQAPSGPGKDPHTLEREARDRERLLKEAQRMAGLAGLASLKRGRGRDEDQGGRRKSRRSEAVYDDENRMKRLEAEREGGRWD